MAVILQIRKKTALRRPSLIFWCNFHYQRITFMNFIKMSSLLLLFLSSTGIAQQRITAEFGRPTYNDLELKTYPKDPEAAGVVLFEKGKNYVKLVDDSYVKLIKEVHRKIKVIDAGNFDGAIVIIPFYKTSNAREEVISIKAITHNGTVQTFLKSADIYETRETENWYLKRFTFPNVQDGAVLEYSYLIESPFYFNFGTWEFQGNIPKVYSEFISEMPGNYIYSRSLVGYESLDINEVSLLEDCFSLPGHVQNADCELAVYAMVDVPAFKKEKYMLSAKNYLAAIKFELVEHTNFKGNKTEYTKDWKDVDKEFRTDKDLGGQLKYESFFKERLPANIHSIGDDLERAKAVYYFIQDHFNWDENFRMSNVRVKEAFEEGAANNTEINLALINALSAANIDAKLVLISTRTHGLPTQLYPVLTDFNHSIASAEIKGVRYLLDATEKESPFGLLPFRDLNGQGRLMDFKNGSSWIPLAPYAKNAWFINAKLAIDENGLMSGKVAETYTGYNAAEKRKTLNKKSRDEYLKDWTKSYIDLEIRNYSCENKDQLEQNLKETYTVQVELVEVSELFLYPFFVKKSFDKNPFTLTERQYPVDFGYPRTETFLLSIDLNDQYIVTELPENKIVKIPGGAGECSIIYGNTNGKLTVRYSYKLKHSYFEAEAYKSLQEFFANIVSMQNKEAIALKRI